MTESTSHHGPKIDPTVRNHLLRALLSLILLGILAAVLMTHFRSELDAVTEFTFRHIGLPGVFVLIFVTDAFVSPLPPDTLLILLAASEYHPLWPWLLPCIGLVSALAGTVGYCCGRLLTNWAPPESVFGKVREKSRRRVEKYGGWAVALGALTPIPFSFTCWTAGFLQVPFAHVAPPCLLRVPRYVLYYLAIAYSGGLL